jgi:hypothetical protein
MKKLSFILLSILLFTACIKQDPPIEGLYLGTFAGHCIVNDDAIKITRNVYIQIISSSDKELALYHSENGDSGLESVVQLDGKNINGTIKTWNSRGGYDETNSFYLITHKEIDITGRWEKLDGEYVITGGFKSIYHFASTAENIDEEYPVEGSFIIKPRQE